MKARRRCGAASWTLITAMSLEDDYKPLVKAHNATLAVLRKEQADTKLQAQMEQARRTYESELETIEGAD